MYKIWKITSFNEYLNSWPSIANKFEYLSTFYKKIGYENPEDFFNKNAYAAQQLANDRVGGIIDRIFKTEELSLPVQNELKKFTYRAIDYLRMNDLEVTQIDRQIQTVYNNGRSDTTDITNGSNMESLIGSSAWRAWSNSKIERLYISYCEQNGINYLLDPDQFYNKVEIDKFLSELDKQIENEHIYFNEKINLVNNEVSKKVNKLDQLLYEQKIDENGEFENEPINLGNFDELQFSSEINRASIITTPSGKKRGIINLSTSSNLIPEATVVQTSSPNDVKNAIGRIWAYEQENNLKKIDEDLNKKIDDLNFINEIRYTLQSNSFLKGWNKYLPFSKETNYFNKEHNEKIKDYEKLFKSDLTTFRPDVEVKDDDPLINLYEIYFWTWNGETKLFEWNLKNNPPEEIEGGFPDLTVEQINGMFENSNLSFDFCVLLDGDYDNKAYYDYPQTAWIYVGEPTSAFSIPYWEEMERQKELETQRKLELEQTAKIEDVEKIVDKKTNLLKEQLEQIAPTVDELKAKEEYRLKKLTQAGMKVKPDYWKDDDNE